MLTIPAAWLMLSLVTSAAPADTAAAPQAQPARTAPAPQAQPAAAAGKGAAPVIDPDWADKAGAKVPDAAAIRAAVRDLGQADPAASNPRRHENDTIRAAPYDAFAAEFADARVPDCLRPDGLKRQSTLIFSGLLALPFVAIAKLRGKCN